MTLGTALKSSRKMEKYWLGSIKFYLYIRSVGEFVLCAPDREKKQLKKDFGEIFWPIDGEAVFFLNGEKHILSPGCVWYYPPDSLHDFYPLKSFHYCWLTVAGKDAGELFELMQLKPGLNRALNCPVYLFRSIFDELDSSSLPSGLNALSTAFKILSMIRLMPQNVGNQQSKKVFLAKESIENNLDDPGLSVERLAYEFGMHRGSLSRAFKQCYGITVSDYIISCRIQKAAELLKTSELSVSEITHLCGMTSPHYFSKVFAGKIGVSPTEFRLRQKSESLT